MVPSFFLVALDVGPLGLSRAQENLRYGGRAGGRCVVCLVRRILYISSRARGGHLGLVSCGWGIATRRCHDVEREHFYVPSRARADTPDHAMPAHHYIHLRAFSNVCVACARVSVASTLSPTSHTGESVTGDEHARVPLEPERSARTSP